MRTRSLYLFRCIFPVKGRDLFYIVSSTSTFYVGDRWDTLKEINVQFVIKSIFGMHVALALLTRLYLVLFALLIDG